jgi:hypothetical protein
VSKENEHFTLHHGSNKLNCAIIIIICSSQRAIYKSEILTNCFILSIISMTNFEALIGESNEEITAKGYSAIIP